MNSDFLCPLYHAGRSARAHDALSTNSISDEAVPGCFANKAEYDKLVAALRGIIHKLHATPSQIDDLTQEGLVHYWIALQKRPRPSRSWCLKSCDYFLHDLVKHGRSVDTGRHHPDYSLDDPRAGSDEEKEAEAPRDDSLLSTVMADEIRDLLTRALHGRSKRVFLRRVLEMTDEEIAGELGCKQQMVSKCMKKVRAIARQMGIEPYQK